MKKWILGFLVLFCNTALAATYHVPTESSDYGLYPIGFSSNGYFAYVIWHDFIDPVGPVADFHFYVQNLKTDEIAVKFDYMNSDDCVDDQGYLVEDLSYVWSHYYDQFAFLLSDYNIVQSSCTFRQFPLDYDGSRISCELVTQDSGRINYCLGEDPMISYDLYAVSSVAGRKHIHSGGGEGLALAEVLGYYRSPYEDRIAVIVREAVPGFECTLDSSLQIVGCNLKSGFRSR